MAPDRSLGPIHVLTGERGAGKSTVCADLARWARLSGYRVAGLLTVRSDGVDTVLSGGWQAERRVVVDLATGHRFAFGSQGHVSAGEPGAAESLPGWRLDADVFQRGNAILAATGPCDLLVVDEVGPLELLQGAGWVRAFKALVAAHQRAALVVCRPLLVEALVARLAGRSVAVIEVTEESRETVLDALKTRLRNTLEGGG